jgi:hypothetical protein
MPDIAMCQNKSCDLKDSCYRFNAKPSQHQQCYGDFKPEPDGYCEGYWKKATVKHNKK